MKKLLFHLMIIFVILLVGACSNEGISPKADLGLLVESFLTDSLGTVKDTFIFGEKIYLHFKITNLTDIGIDYSKVSYIERLMAFSISPTESFGELDEIFLPPGPDSILDLLLDPNKALESIDELPFIDVGRLSISICPLIIFNREELNLSSRFRVDFKIIGEK